MQVIIKPITNLYDLKAITLLGKDYDGDFVSKTTIIFGGESDANND